MAVKRIRTNESDGIVLHLEKLIAEMSSFLRRHGISKPIGISSENRSIFLNWPIEKLRLVSQNAERMLRVHLEAERDQKFDFDDTPELLRLALGELGLSVDPEFYNKIERSDILEVYDTDNIQIFRSFNFFHICNYNLDDVLSHEWWQLYERDEPITDQIMAAFKHHFGGSQSITQFNIPEHFMRERLAEAPGQFLTTFKYIGSVYSGPQRAPGVVITIGARILETEKNQNIDFIRPKRI